MVIFEKKKFSTNLLTSCYINLFFFKFGLKKPYTCICNKFYNNNKKFAYFKTNLYAQLYILKAVPHLLQTMHVFNIISEANWTSKKSFIMEFILVSTKLNSPTTFLSHLQNT